MDFIFMLTRQDETVEDCLEVFEEIRSVGLGHVGFKDLGTDSATLKALNRAIKDSGATSYMEVVATSPDAALASARLAAEIGVDRLLGGTQVRETLRLLKGRSLAYYPFPGRPDGHPTRLGGTPDLVERQCRELMDMGCAGVDLLAYRASEADPLALVEAARRGLDGRGDLICAGSIASRKRVEALKKAGCDAFTIGSAAFDGTFSPRKGTLCGRLEDILAAC